MNIIRQRRLDLGLSQEQLAIKCAVPRQRISEYERGVALPDRETSNRISQEIGVKVLLDQGHILKPGKTNLCAIRRYEMREPKREIWTRAFVRWREQIQVAKLPERVLAWLEQYVPADSVTEAATDLQMIMGGAVCRLANPHAWGFRRQTIVDDRGMALGERRLPCFHWLRDGMECILWPQVNLRPADITFRVDFLVLVRYGSKIMWCILEVDGSGHRFENDAFRNQQLGLTDIRLSHQEVTNWRVARLVPERLRDFVVGKRKAS